MSPQGWLLRVRPIEVHGREGLCILMHESSWHDDVAVVTSSLLGVVAALDEEQARLKVGAEVTWLGSPGVAHHALRGPASLNARASM